MIGLLTDRQNTVTDEITEEPMPTNGEASTSAMDKFVLPVVPDASGKTISLATLIDLAVQSTYAELTTLSEQLRTMADLDRKVAINRFSNSTRRLFLKLYALVKWLKSSKRFDTLNSICYLLDQQSNYFVDTADRFVQIAHEEMVFCRLPIFQLSLAVDALSLGTHPRMPQSIKRDSNERPLNYRQTMLTIRRLHRMMEYRLGQEAALIPAGIHDIRVANGVTTFTANGEFELKMTLTRNDWPNDDELRGWSWTIVDLKILVESLVAGHGQDLMHPSQIEQLAEFCQSRMYNGVRDINIVYTVLHNFAMTMQLDAYRFEAVYLEDTISSSFVSVEFYDEREKYLRLRYWGVPGCQMPYRIEIFYTYYEQSASDSWLERLQQPPLRLRHHPPAPGLPEFPIDESYPNLRSILDRTVLRRSADLMESIRDVFESLGRGDPRIKCIGWMELRGEYQLLSAKPMISERLRIGVNMLTGQYVCQMDLLDETEELEALAKALNSGQMPASTAENAYAIRRAVQRIQFALLVLRHLRAFDCAPIRRCDSLQPVSQLLQQIENLPRTKYLFEFIECPDYYLLLLFRPVADPLINVKVEVLAVQNIEERRAIDEKPLAEEMPSVVTLELEAAAKTYPFPTAEEGTLDICRQSHQNAVVVQRQIRLAIAIINEKIQFRGLIKELQSMSMEPEPLKGEPMVGGFVLSLGNLRPLLADDADDEFLEKVAVAAIRIDTTVQKQRMSTDRHSNIPMQARMNGFAFEVSILDPPVVPDYGRNLERNRTDLYSHVQDVFVTNVCTNNDNTESVTRESVYENVKHRLWTYDRTFRIVRDFAEAYIVYFKDHCNIVLYTFHKLILAYGRDRNQLVAVTAKCPRGPPEQTLYLLSFFQTHRPALNEEERQRALGQAGRPRKKKDKISQCSRAWNPHTLMTQALRDKFGDNPDLCSLVNYLINTDRSLAAIYHFSDTRLATLKSYSQLLGFAEKEFPIELKTSLVTLNDNHVRLCYGVSHVDFRLLSNNRVLISAHRLRDTIRRDYDHEYDGLPFFRDFWNRMSIANVRETGELVEDVSGFDFTAVDGGPRSFPPRSSAEDDDHNPAGQSDAKPKPPPSCTPRICDDPISEHPPAVAPAPNLSSPNSQLHSGSRHLPLPIPHLVVEIEALEKAVTAVPLLDDHTSDSPQLKPAHWKPPERVPLDDYLHAVTFMARIGPAMEMCSRSQLPGRPQLPLADLHWSNRAISFEVAGFPSSAVGPQQGGPQPSSWNVRMRFYICAERFRVRCALTFVSHGAKIPDQTDVDVFERYFERVVAPLSNEFAVISFITMCRLTSAGVFTAFARIMQAQMEPLLPFCWYVNLQLVAFHSSKEQPGGSQMRCGVMLDRNRSVLLMVRIFLLTGIFQLLLRKSPSFAKTKKSSEQRNPDDKADRPKAEEKQWFSKTVPLCYNLETNQMMVLRTSDSSPELESIVQRAMSLQNANRECSIWSCVRLILQEYLIPVDQLPTPMAGAQPQNPLSAQNPPQQQMGMFPNDQANNPNLAAELANPNMPPQQQRMHPAANPMQNQMMGNHPGGAPPMSGVSTMPPQMGNPMSSGQPPMGPMGSNNPMSNSGMSTGAPMSVGGPPSMGSMGSAGPMGPNGPMGATGPMGTPGGGPMGSTGPMVGNALPQGGNQMNTGILMGSSGAPPSVSTASSLNPRSAGASGNGPSPLGPAVTPNSMAPNPPTGPMGGPPAGGMHSGMMNPQPSGHMQPGGPMPGGPMGGNMPGGGSMSGMRPMGAMPPMHSGMMMPGGGGGPMGAGGPMGPGGGPVGSAPMHPGGPMGSGPMGTMGAGGPNVPMSAQQPMNAGGPMMSQSGPMMSQSGPMGPGGMMAGRGGGGPHQMHPMQQMSGHPNAAQMPGGPMMGGGAPPPPMPHHMQGGHPGAQMGMGGMPPHPQQQPPKDFAYR